MLHLNRLKTQLALSFSLISIIFLTGCGGSKAPMARAQEATAVSMDPPQGQAALDAWLATGAYKSWACEVAPQQRRGAHGANRVCSNSLASAAGPGAYPVGAASVKELYDNNGQINGYAVSKHVAVEGEGAGWYWYERIGSRVIADGLGDAGTAKRVCASCHAAAWQGSAAGHDFVYVQVR